MHIPLDIQHCEERVCDVLKSYVTRETGAYSLAYGLAGCTGDYVGAESRQTKSETRIREEDGVGGDIESDS